MVSKCVLLVVLVALAGAEDAKPIPTSKPSMTVAPPAKGKGSKGGDYGTAAVKDTSKMQGTSKVTAMLTALANKVNANAAAELGAWTKFNAYCTAKKADKNSAISSGTAAIASTQGSLDKKNAAKTAADVALKAADDARAAAETEKARLTKEEKKSIALSKFNQADLLGAYKGVSSAKKVMGANQAKGNTVLLQMPSGLKDEIQRYALMGDALGLASGSEVTALMQTESSGNGFLQTQKPRDRTANYKDAGGPIMAMLTKLKKDFKKAYDDCVALRAANKATFVKAETDQKNIISRKTALFNEKTTLSNSLAADIAQLVEDMKGLKAQLADDQSYLAELSTVCDDKTASKDQRQKNYLDEEAAIRAAVGAMGGVVAREDYKLGHFMLTQTAKNTVHHVDRMEAIEAAVEDEEGASLSFIQRHISQNSNPYFDSIAPNEADSLNLDLHQRNLLQDARQEESQPTSTDGKQRVISMLRTSGMKFHSAALTGLSMTIGKLAEDEVDPMAKIKALITSLVDRLVAQAAAEAQQKGFCDKAIGDATRTRDLNQDKNKTLTNQLAGLAAKNASLFLEVNTLVSEVNQLMADQNASTTTRNSERINNTNLVTDATTSMAAINNATAQLNLFYNQAKKNASAVAAKAEGKKFTKDSDIEKNMKKSKAAKDMPADMRESDDYNGDQGAASGIFGLLEVLASDFQNSISSTERSEAKSQEDYEKLKLSTTISITEKNTLKADRNAQRTAACDDHALKVVEKSTAEGHIDTKNQELKDLQPVCSPPEMTHAEREAARQDEIGSLRNALTTLEEGNVQARDMSRR